MSKQIFIYKKSAKPSHELLTELEKAGYICVPVEMLDDVKIITSFNFLDQSGTFLLKAAWETIEKGTYSAPREEFSKKVLAEIKRQLFADAG